MQQKNLKYLLLAGVALIWGTVIYRLLNGMGDNNTSMPFRQKLAFKIKDSSNYQPYELLANYDDPFGVVDEKDGQDSSGDAVIKSAAKFSESNAVYTAKPDISFIQYKGIITNPVTHKKAAIISINGKDEFVHTNSKISNISINIIKKDKISITYLNEKIWIKRQ